MFDSGVGGLTVAAAIHQRMPAEDIVYLGDTARVPYGNKSAETIVRYSRQDLEFLLRERVKAVVVACNTATAYALDSLRSLCALPVLGVVEPGVEAALAATQTGRVGIIGTAGTIGSGAYQKALLDRRPDLTITALATPLLVPLIEENWVDRKATRLVLDEYMAPLCEAGIDTLVLACTHYPLLKPTLARVLGPSVTLVDSAENMAIALERALDQGGLRRATPGTGGLVRVHVTDLTASFTGLARRFLGERCRSIEAVRVE
jgi:glutamate racemase